MKIWYFENIHRDKSNDILYDIIYLCILVEKYDQNKFGQNYIFSNGSSITGRREYYIFQRYWLNKGNFESEQRLDTDKPWNHEAWS